MSWHELLSQEILIGLPDNDIGFIYTVKYGGVAIRRGFVPVMNEERSEHGTLFVPHEAAEEDPPKEE